MDFEILNFHDSPGFPGPVRTLYIPKRKKVTQDKMIFSNDEYLSILYSPLLHCP